MARVVVWTAHLALPILGLWLLLVANPGADIIWQHHQTHFWLVLVVVAADVGVMSMLLEQGPGTLYPSEDAAALAAAVLGQLDAPALPELTVPDWAELVSGIEPELRKMASARTLVLVTFWATWCAPCRTELTQLTDLYTRRRGDGLEILAVNEDDDARQLAFLEKRALPFPVLVDPGGAVAAQYGVDAFPVSILVDGDGNVLKVIRGASELLPHVVETLKSKIRPRSVSGQDASRAAVALFEGRLVALGDVRAGQFRPTRVFHLA